MRTLQPLAPIEEAPLIVLRVKLASQARDQIIHAARRACRATHENPGDRTNVSGKLRFELLEVSDGQATLMGRRGGGDRSRGVPRRG